MDSAIDVSESLEPEPNNPEFSRDIPTTLGPSSLSVSPTSTFKSGSHGRAGGLSARSYTGSASAPRLPSKQLKPFNTEDIKILLLENVNATGRDLLTAQGYQVTFLKSSLPEDELIEKIR